MLGREVQRWVGERGGEGQRATTSASHKSRITDGVVVQFRRRLHCVTLVNAWGAGIRQRRMATLELPEGERMVGRSKPAQLRTTELVKAADVSLDSSPMGTALMARKAQRHRDPSSTRQASMASPDGGRDSPGWETNFRRLLCEENSGLRENNSSPHGAALLRKKVDRQHHGKPMPRSGGLQQPAMRPLQLSPGSDQL